MIDPQPKLQEQFQASGDQISGEHQDLSRAFLPSRKKGGVGCDIESY